MNSSEAYMIFRQGTPSDSVNYSAQPDNQPTAKTTVAHPLHLVE